MSYYRETFALNRFLHGGRGLKTLDVPIYVNNLVYNKGQKVECSMSPNKIDKSQGMEVLLKVLVGLFII